MRIFILAVAAILAAITFRPQVVTDLTDAATRPAPEVTDARTALATLPVKPAASVPGYSRAQFGPAWADTDRNGCDQRDDVLARDLSMVERRGPCTVVEGVLTDPYTGDLIEFQRGPRTSAAVQIDHVVSLGDAWATGAASWPPVKREALATNLANLQATDGPTNEAKGDRNAAQWLPPDAGYRCTYVERQIAVKAAYGLWVTQAEHDAMGAVLGSC